MNKLERFESIKRLLYSHPEGLRRADIARRLGVYRSTVGRDIEALSLYFPVQEDRGYLFVDPLTCLESVAFDIHETIFLHLAARLYSGKLNYRNNIAASAMRKLAGSVDNLAPHVRQSLNRTADETEGSLKENKPCLIQTLKTLNIAWARMKQVKVEHTSSKGNTREYILDIHYIEPCADGHGIYVFGWCKAEDKMRNLRIDRISKAVMLDEDFRMEDDFDSQEYFRYAWNIWVTGTVTKVVLRFTPRVAQRVRETLWHSSQEISTEPDGGILFKVTIHEPLEMLPWIRGWGRDVEILQPLDLRDEMIHEIGEMKKIYAG